MSDAGPPPPGGNPMFRPIEGGNPYARPTVPPPPVVQKRGRQARGGIPAALVLAIVLVVAVGGGFFLIRRSQSSSDPGQALTSFVRAVYARDAGKVCDKLAKSNIERIEDDGGGTCEEGMNEAFASVQEPDEPTEDDPNSLLTTDATDESVDVKILKVVEKGDRAEVTARIDGEKADPVVLVKEDGEWKVDIETDSTCTRVERTMSTAAEAYEAQTGTPAPNVKTLVDEGFILKAYPEATVTDGEVTMVGECA